MEEQTQPQTQNGMNMKVIIGVVLAIIVIGFIAFSMNGKSDQASNGQSSLKELLASGKSQKCSITSISDTQQSSGDVYVANGMMRGDFTSVSNGQTVKNHMIVKEDTSYVWLDMMNQGFKMKFAEMPAQSSGTQSQQAVNVDQKYDFKCENWSADENLFMLPEGTTFTDLAEMMKGGIPAGMIPGGN